MQPDFWLDRWRTAQIGFHQAAADRHLKAYWPRLKLPAHSPVFVPLCGKSLDLMWLRNLGHAVTGVELSPLALESFVMEHGIPALRRVLQSFDVFEADGFSAVLRRLLQADSGTARQRVRRVRSRGADFLGARGASSLRRTSQLADESRYPNAIDRGRVPAGANAGAALPGDPRYHRESLRATTIQSRSWPARRYWNLNHVSRRAA